MLGYFLSRVYASYKKYRRLGKSIKRTDIVLDIGSGPEHPFYRADILLDIIARAYNRDSRPLIQADICNLPFRDKSIDYIYCNHVLEHVPDVRKALSELQRVGRRGYIEVPLGFTEEFFAENPLHRWLVKLDNGKLVFMPKDEAFVSFQESFNPLTQEIARLAPKTSRRLYQETMPFRAISCEWVDDISFEVCGEQPSCTTVSNFPRQWSYKRGWTGRLFHLAWVFIAWLSKLRYQKRIRRIDLLALLRCTLCGGSLTEDAAMLKCQNCSASFPVENGIIRMLPEQAKRREA